MAEDYYATLGVPRTATPEEIHKAYRNLARKYHPDLNPDDEDAKKKFQEIQHAYETLKDPKKRELFDRYGSGYESMGGAAAGGGPWRPRPGQAGPGGFQDVDLSDLFGDDAAGGGGFSDIFRQFTRRPGRRNSAGAPRAANIEHELPVPLRTAVSGGTAQITVRRRAGKVETINVKIPAGIEDGKKIRLKGQGEPAAGGGQAGDILITVRIAPHPCYQRQGNDLIVKVPVTLNEAIFGGKIDVPTPKGTISLTLPAGSSSGKRLRVKGHGVQQPDLPGDLYAEINIVLPEVIDEAARQVLQQLQLGPGDPRSNLVW